MMFQNEYEIARNMDRFATHPALGPATRFLHAFMCEVNAHSDGWPYWCPPVHAAAKLMTLINTGNATAADVRKAIGPIRAFMTRRGTAAGMTLPTLEV